MQESGTRPSEATVLELKVLKTGWGTEHETPGRRGHRELCRRPQLAAGSVMIMKPGAEAPPRLAVGGGCGGCSSVLLR